MTNFSEKVYKTVKKIPKGRVSTYLIIARKIGTPKAYRAVGNALNKNRDKNVSCHRVVLSTGSVGGFSRGIKKKIEILNGEDVKIKDKKIQNFSKVLYR